MKKLFLLLPVLFFVACEKQVPNVEIEVLQDEVTVSDSEEFICGRDKVKDADGNEYMTAYFDVDGGHDVNKDGQCWMAENLNVGKVILNPGDEPKDDGVVEKWCMTDDWSAERIEECDYGSGSVEGICKEREERRESGKIKSNIAYCNGAKGIMKSGGLYQWQEIMNYDLSVTQGICPDEWELPENSHWEELTRNIQAGIDLTAVSPRFLNSRQCEEAYIEENSEEDCRNNMEVGRILKTGEFLGERVGIYMSQKGGTHSNPGNIYGVFSKRGQEVQYFTMPIARDFDRKIYIPFRSLFTVGDYESTFDGPWQEYFSDNKDKAFSIRCIKK